MQALSPMLIVVRVGLGLNHVGNPTTYVSTVRSEPLSAPRFAQNGHMGVRVGVSVTETNDSTLYTTSNKDNYQLRDIKSTPDAESV